MQTAARRKATKRSVNLSLNHQLIKDARALTDNLSAEIEILLAEFIRRKKAEREEERESLRQAALMSKEYVEKYGSLSDEFSTL